MGRSTGLRINIKKKNENKSRNGDYYLDDDDDCDDDGGSVWMPTKLKRICQIFWLTDYKR